MASYEKQTIQASQFGGVNGYSKPPEVMVCIDCGAVVWPTRMQLHDAWHAKLAKLEKRDLSYGTPVPQRRRPGNY